MTMRTAVLSDEDEHYLSLAEQARDAYPERPALSKFRVVAVLAYEDSQGNRSHVLAGNIECAEIGNALCAERAAIAQLQFRNVKRVRSVYIVSDAATCLTPGTLCREFLSASPLLTPQTPFVSRATDCKPCVTTLAELYPFPCIYSRLERQDVLPFACEFCRKALHDADPIDNQHGNNNNENEPGSKFVAAQCELMSKAEQQAYVAAHHATAHDTRDDLFPLRYAAAVLFSDGTQRVAWQHKTLEYGSSLDAVSKLIAFIEDAMLQDPNVKPVAVLQVDQFGILHAPSARARAYLYEYEFRDVQVLVHDAEGRLQRLPVENLVFSSPDCIADTTAGCS